MYTSYRHSTLPREKSFTMKKQHIVHGGSGG
jgi:hypothetical protein